MTETIGVPADLAELGPLRIDSWPVQARAAVEKARVDLLLGDPNSVVAALPIFLSGAPNQRDADGDWVLMIVQALYGRALFARHGSPAGTEYLGHAVDAYAEPSARPAAIDLEDSADLAAAFRLLDRPEDAVDVVEHVARSTAERTGQELTWPWRVRYEYARAMRLTTRDDCVTRAAEVLRSALLVKPGEPTMLHELAKCAELLGEPERGSELAVRAARGYLARGRGEQCREAIALARQLAPDAPLVLTEAAWLEVLDERTDDALRLLDQAAPQLAGQPAYESIRAVALSYAQRPEEAVAAARHVLAQRPDDWLMLETASRCLIDLRRPEEIAPLLDAARARSGATPGLLTLYARAAEAQQNDDQARGYYRQVLEVYQDDLEALRGLARVAERHEEWAAARPWLEQITRLAQHDSAAWWHLGVAVWNLEDYPAARDAFEIASGEMPAALTALGLTRVELGEADLGLVDLRAALERDPLDRFVVVSYARTLLRTERDGAEQVLADWVRATTDPDAPAVAGQLLLEHGQPVAALPYLEQAFARADNTMAVLPVLVAALAVLGRAEELAAVAAGVPDDSPLPSRTVGQIAAALIDTGDLDGAARWAQAAVERTPDDPVALRTNGDVARRRGDYGPAERDLRAALAQDPTDLEATGSLGRLLRATGHNSEAADRLAEYVAAGTDSADIRAEYADTLLLTGRAGQALEEVEAAVALAPTSPWIVGLRGATLRALDRADDALDVLAQAIELPDCPPWVATERAACLQQTDRVDEAVRYARELVANSPQEPLFRGALAFALVSDDRISESVELLSDTAVQGSFQYAAAQRAVGLYLLSRHEEAVAELERLLTAAPADDWIRLHLANARLHCEPARAVDALRTLEPVPDERADMLLWLARGEAHLFLGDRSEARRCFEQGERRGKHSGSSDGTTLHGLGWLALRLGRARDGVRLLNRAADRRPTPALLMDIGLAVLHTSRPEDAIHSYERAIALVKTKDDPMRTRGVCLEAWQDLTRTWAETPQSAVDTEKIQRRLEGEIEAVDVAPGMAVTRRGPVHTSNGASDHA